VGEPAMELGNRELEKIGEYVQKHLNEWMQAVRSPRELDLIERVIRVEEGLKKLHEQMDLRFDTQLQYLDKRFEAHQQDVNTRFEVQQQYLDKRFEEQLYYMDQRFQQVDKRFEANQQNMDKRFKSLQWFMGIGFTLLAALIGLLDIF
jgi:DNA anti-recombination protein RmuC